MKKLFSIFAIVGLLIAFTPNEISAQNPGGVLVVKEGGVIFGGCIVGIIPASKTTVQYKNGVIHLIHWQYDMSGTCYAPAPGTGNNKITVGTPAGPATMVITQNGVGKLTVVANPNQP